MNGKTKNTKTITGTLEYGIEYQGAVHKDFVLRQQTVGDEIDAAEADAPDSAYGAVLMAMCLDSLGTIPKEEITYQLIRGLSSDDYIVLQQKRVELKKKLKDMNANTGTSASPASACENTATQTKTSAPLVL